MIMSLSDPILRQVSWLSVILQVIVTVLLMEGYKFLGFNNPVLDGALTYSLMMFGLRFLIAKDHRKGIALARQEKFEEAISYFEKSHHFFTKYSWIDKYRSLTLLSSSKICCREMSLNNTAFCYLKLKDRQKAIEYYSRMLEANPNCEIAKTQLKVIHEIEEQIGL
jgi:tetratricopeptide (TPR) repeat protein